MKNEAATKEQDPLAWRAEANAPFLRFFAGLCLRSRNVGRGGVIYPGDKIVESGDGEQKGHIYKMPRTNGGEGEGRRCHITTFII